MVGIAIPASSQRSAEARPDDVSTRLPDSSHELIRINIAQHMYSIVVFVSLFSCISCHYIILPAFDCYKVLYPYSGRRAAPGMINHNTNIAAIIANILFISSKSSWSQRIISLQWTRTMAVVPRYRALTRWLQ